MDISLKETVQLLRVPEATVRRWVRQGYIPCAYRDGNYRFNPDRLKSWAKIKHINLNTKNNLKSNHLHPEKTDLITALTRGGCYYHVKGETKDAIFDEVENLFALTTSSLAKQLKQREQLSATGIGKGFAIPHPQYPNDWNLDGPAVGIFFLETPVDFDALDQLPVFVLFVLLSPTSQIHLKLLSQLAQILRGDTMSDFFQQQPSFEDVTNQFKKILEQDSP